MPFKHISQATEEAVQYIEKRKNHEIESLKTRWDKFNSRCMGGIEPNAIYTITGISGSGKSSFVNTLETDLIDLNPHQDIVVLSFSFEMLSSRQVGRKLSYKLKQTTSDLYSSNTELEDDLLTQVRKEAEIIRNYPIYYVDNSSTVEDIGNTIRYFHETIAKDKWLIVILDHALLVNGNDNSDNERKIIIGLQNEFIRIKKLSNTTIIQISQMNRNIESPERILNPSSHFPMRSDLSTSDAIFQSSDYVIVLHRPELLGIKSYGIQRLLVQNMVYLHILKNRDGGDPAILEFENNLKYNDLIESNRNASRNQSISNV